IPMSSRLPAFLLALLPSMLGRLPIHAWAASHPCLGGFPSMLGRLPIHAWAASHPCLGSFPSMLGRLPIHAWAASHPCLGGVLEARVRDIASERTQCGPTGEIGDLAPGEHGHRDMAKKT